MIESSGGESVHVLREKLLEIVVCDSLDDLLEVLKLLDFIELCMPDVIDFLFFHGD